MAAAQELAELVGLDVDTFIAMVILELRDQESAEGRLRARMTAGKQVSNGRVIPMAANRGKRPRRAQARIE